MNGQFSIAMLNYQHQRCSPRWGHGLSTVAWSAATGAAHQVGVGERNIPHPVFDHHFPLLNPIKITKIAGNETDPPQFWTNSNIGSVRLQKKLSPAISREFPVKWLLNPTLFRFWGLMFYSSHVFLAVIQCIYMIIHYTYIYICIQYTVYSIYRKREQERVYYNHRNIQLNVESWLSPFKSQVRPPLCGSRHLFFGSSRARSSSTTWRQGARATTSTSERLRILKNSNVGKTMPFAPSPSHHHEYMWYGAPIPTHGWFMALFYPHYTVIWHNYGRYGITMVNKNSPYPYLSKNWAWLQYLTYRKSPFLNFANQWKTSIDLKCVIFHSYVKLARVTSEPVPVWDALATVPSVLLSWKIVMSKHLTAIKFSRGYDHIYICIYIYIY